MRSAAKGRTGAAKALAVLGLTVWFLLGGIVPGTAHAGWVITSRHGSGKRFDSEATYFQKDRIRAESGQTAHVMDFVARRIIWIDHAERRYSVMTFEQFRQMIRESMRAARQAMDEMKARGIAIPGQAAKPKGKVTVSRIEGATVAGYACDGYRIFVGGKPEEDLWVTRKIDLSSEIGPAVMKEFEDLSREMRRTGFASRSFEEDPAYEKIVRAGYPMKTVDKESGYVNEVTRVERKSIDAALFAEPRGYRKQTFEEMMGGGGQASGGPAAPRRLAPGARGAGGRTPAEVKPAPAVPSAGGSAEEAGEQAAEEAREQKEGALDAIRGGAREGIRKMLGW